MDFRDRYSIRRHLGSMRLNYISPFLSWLTIITPASVPFKDIAKLSTFPFLCLPITIAAMSLNVSSDRFTTRCPSFIKPVSRFMIPNERNANNREWDVGAEQGIALDRKRDELKGAEITRNSHVSISSWIRGECYGFIKDHDAWHWESRQV